MTAFYDCFDDEDNGTGVMVLEDCGGGDLAAMMERMEDECPNEEEVVQVREAAGAGIWGAPVRCKFRRMRFIRLRIPGLHRLGGEGRLAACRVCLTPLREPSFDSNITSTAADIS